MVVSSGLAQYPPVWEEWSAKIDILPYQCAGFCRAWGQLLRTCISEEQRVVLTTDSPTCEDAGQRCHEGDKKIYFANFVVQCVCSWTGRKPLPRRR